MSDERVPQFATGFGGVPGRNHPLWTTTAALMFSPMLFVLALTMDPHLLDELVELLEEHRPPWVA